MAVLSDADRATVSADLQSDLSGAREAISGCTKTDIRAAVNALDDFLVANATAINNALPTAAKNGLTQAQKARLLMAVIRKRYLTGA